MGIGDIVYYRLPGKITWQRGKIMRFPAEGLVELDKASGGDPIVVSKDEVVMKQEIVA